MPDSCALPHFIFFHFQLASDNAISSSPTMTIVQNTGISECNVRLREWRMFIHHQYYFTRFADTNWESLNFILLMSQILESSHIFMDLEEVEFNIFLTSVGRNILTSPLYCIDSSHHKFSLTESNLKSKYWMDFKSSWRRCYYIVEMSIMER